MITLNSITHTYRGEIVPALLDVSLTLGESTVTALVGPNGSGKTTLMQILGGLMVPTSGSISIDGSQASADDLLTSFDHRFFRSRLRRAVQPVSRRLRAPASHLG